MAIAAVGLSREQERRAWNDPQTSVNYEYLNYATPNLAPRAIEAGYRARPQRETWRTAPAPPPDPIWAVLLWMLRSPALPLLLAYTLWLGFWSLYALRAFSDF